MDFASKLVVPVVQEVVQAVLAAQSGKSPVEQLPEDRWNAGYFPGAQSLQ